MTDEQTGWLGKAGRPVLITSRWFERIGMFFLAAMALATLVDVIGSKVFQRPLPGSTEITGLLQIVAIAGGVAYSKIDGRHIRVEFLVEWLPKAGQAVLDLFGALLGLIFFVVASWMSYIYCANLFSAGTSTFLLGIPLYPFAFWIALAFIPMCFVLILESLVAIGRMFR